MITKYKDEIKYPLYGFAIPLEEYMWIRQLISPGATILELGSGPGSTGNLSQHYKMYSIEHDSRYTAAYNSNCNYLYIPLKNSWYDIDILKNKIKDICYDLILIDGPPGEGSRDKFIDHIELFNTSVPIVIDDTHRSGEYAFAKKVSNTINRPITFIDAYDELSVYNKRHGFGVIM